MHVTSINHLITDFLHLYKDNKCSKIRLITYTLENHTSDSQYLIKNTKQQGIILYFEFRSDLTSKLTFLDYLKSNFMIPHTERRKKLFFFFFSNIISTIHKGRNHRF